jgi:hypothetical protein
MIDTNGYKENEYFVNTDYRKSIGQTLTLLLLEGLGLSGVQELLDCNKVQSPGLKSAKCPWKTLMDNLLHTFM